MYPQRSVMTCGLATALEPPHFNHAPVRGATRLAQMFQRERSVVSIHAPAWGATRPYTFFTQPRIGFNPRTRVGCDVVNLVTGAGDGMVSIHAPAWGATSSMETVAPLASLFQSTHPRGVRLSGYVQAVAEVEFQSTHPRGVRRVVKTLAFHKLTFQSTHPRGVRPPPAG